jgi:hypothetical protein
VVSYCVVVFCPSTISYGSQKGQELLTLSITIKRDKVEAKVENSLCKLDFAFPCMIYF